MSNEPSLADTFVAATYTIPRHLNLTAKETKILEPTLERYRQTMKKAYRFALSDEFTELATEVSSVAMTPQKLLTRLQYATLPYGVTWIEFDTKVKVRKMREIHGADMKFFDWGSVGHRIGLILYRLSEAEVLCEFVCEGPKHLLPALTCYYFSLREHDFNLKEGAEYGCQSYSSAEALVDLASASDAIYRDPAHTARILAAGRKVGKGALWGFSRNARSGGMIESRQALKSIVVPEFLERHGDTGYSGFFTPMRRICMMQGPREIDSMANVLEQEAVEFAGLIRWVVTVLGMLNQVPLKTTQVTPTGNIRAGLLRRTPLQPYHVLDIKLPKNAAHPAKYVNRKFQEAHKNRAHEVRSHWRNYLSAVACKPEDHAWEYDYDEGYRLCGTCDAFGRLIPEHVRGDASLGWVLKDYKIKA